MANVVLDKSKWGWWKSAVFYELYPKSFQDTDGDGVGDLKGILSRLDYLQELGIDAIWLCPVCQSPQVDNGYDISDYCAIDPMFGTMEEMDELIAQAKARGIGIIMDLVLNHCSNQHPWFRSAVELGEDSPYYNYFLWRKGVDGSYPNDMKAVFGGPAWTYVPELDLYYFHQFAPEQPDRNWDNPEMRKSLYQAIRFGVDKGVAGFRLDVIDQIGKDPDQNITINGPKLHDFLRDLSKEAFIEEGLVTVGEAWGADMERAKLYSAPDCSEMSMVFQFEHICLDQEPGKDKWDMIPLSLPKFKAALARWQEGLYGTGWNSLFMNNHDLPRVVSRWGNPREYREESAKMLATMLHGMQGTPFIYQGEELGMTNVHLPIEEYVDLESVNLYRERVAQGYAPEDVLRSIWARGRDNARTPMQWNDSPNAGFTTGKPWLAVNENYRDINAEAALADPESIFYYYQQLIALRKANPVLQDGKFALLLPEDEQIFAYTRELDGEKMLIVCNFSGEYVPFDLPEEFYGCPIVLGNYPGECDRLRPYEAMIFHKTL